MGMAGRGYIFVQVRCPLQPLAPERGWELNCLCCWKTYVVIYPRRTRGVQKTSVLAASVMGGWEWFVYLSSAGLAGV
jgi:hypothetical protein